MAVDKKSDHYTSAQNYTDLDGQSRSFTFVDHDKKTKVSTNVDVEGATKRVVAYKQGLAEKILSLPASACPEIFMDFTVRGEQGISWNTTMITDAGISIERLEAIRTVTENRIAIYGL